VAHFFSSFFAACKGSSDFLLSLATNLLAVEVASFFYDLLAVRD